eukprot:5520905-Ditylum_brightwellii.AAC.1
MSGLHWGCADQILHMPYVQHFFSPDQARALQGRPLASWLDEKDTPMGIWRKRITLSNAIYTGNGDVDETGNDFFKRTREMKTPLQQNRDKGIKCKTPPVDKQQGNADTTDDITLVKPMKVKELIDAVKVSVHSLVVYMIGNSTTQVSIEAATDNINARLTNLEDFVGSKYDNSVGVDYPNVTIALNKTVSRLEELYIKLDYMVVSLPGIREAVQVMSDQQLNDKSQIST